MPAEDVNRLPSLHRNNSLLDLKCHQLDTPSIVDSQPETETYRAPSPTEELSRNFLKLNGHLQDAIAATKRKRATNHEHKHPQKECDSQLHNTEEDDYRGSLPSSSPLPSSFPTSDCFPTLQPTRSCSAPPFAGSIDSSLIRNSKSRKQHACSTSSPVSQTRTLTLLSSSLSLSAIPQLRLSAILRNDDFEKQPEAALFNSLMNALSSQSPPNTPPSVSTLPYRKPSSQVSQTPPARLSTITPAARTDLLAQRRYLLMLGHPLSLVLSRRPLPTLALTCSTLFKPGKKSYARPIKRSIWEPKILSLKH